MSLKLLTWHILSFSWSVLARTWRVDRLGFESGFISYSRWWPWRWLTASTHEVKRDNDPSLTTAKPQVSAASFPCFSLTTAVPPHGQGKIPTKACPPSPCNLVWWADRSKGRTRQLPGSHQGKMISSCGWGRTGGLGAWGSCGRRVCLAQVGSALRPRQQECGLASICHPLWLCWPEGTPCWAGPLITG